MLKRLLENAVVAKSSSDFVALEGANVVIAPPVLADQTDWLALRTVSRGFLTPWEPKWPEDSLSPLGYRVRLRYFIKEWQNGSSYIFFVRRLEDAALVGGIALNNVRYGSCLSASVGYWVGLPFARHGYTFEALLLVLRFAFGHVKLNRIEAACMPHNKPSCRLLVKAGFHFEGLARSYLQIDGHWQDHMIFSRLHSDPPVYNIPIVYRAR